MKKLDEDASRRRVRSIINFILMTKLAVVLAFAFSIQSFAHGYGQANLHLHLDHAPLKKALKSIENQSAFRFVYKDDVLPHDLKVSLDVQGATLEEVLGKLLEHTNLDYQRVSSNLVVIEQRAAQAAAVLAQGVSGRVTNARGEPVPGASVTEKGTNNGTITKDDGSYALTPTGDAAILVISSVGYATQEIKVSRQAIIDVQLRSTAADLNEVVVIGYQSVRKKDLTGATGVVDMTNANRISAGSVGESIQGLVPGVTVRNGGAPGENAAIEIRGVGSFGNSDPLYVIDGMLSDANTTVNTDDIASIQVLKDASAAAIYGSRAGNGVIIITTRKGKDGPAKVSFSAKYGTQSFPKRWDLMGAPQYLQTVKQQYANSGLNLTPGMAAQLANNTINTNWQDQFFKTGSVQDYNASISGGSAAGNYLLSGSYYKNQGDIIGNAFERSSIRLNTEAKKGRLTVGENMMMSATDQQTVGGGSNPIYDAVNLLPVIAVQGDQYKNIPSNPAGWGMGTTDFPTYAANYTALTNIDRQTATYDKLIGNAYAEFKFFDWLSYRFNLGGEVSFDYHKEVRDTGIVSYAAQPPLTSVYEDREQFTNFLMEHTLNFNKSFGRHNLNGVVGFSRTQQRRDVTYGSRTALTDVNGNNLTTISSAVGAPSVGGSTPLFWRAHGYLGRINYSYNDLYLLTLTGRIDQDSRFGSNFRTGYFPSAAAAWRISHEKFFTVKWINDLKIRASYGQLGFSDVLGSWDYIGTLNNSPRAIYGSSQSPQVGQYLATLPNPNLRWESRTQKNAGFDASILDNRLSLTFDVYSSLSKDVLVAPPQPGYLGTVGVTNENAGSIRNSGVELGLTYRNDRHLLRWDVSANMTTIHNEVVSVGDQGVDASGNHVNYIEYNNFIRAQVGHAIGSWYVLKTDGIFQSQQQINSYVGKGGGLIQPFAKPGDIKYLDANGDGSINDNDRQFVGSPWPTLQTGAQFNAYYHQFSFNLQLVGIFGYKLYDDVRRTADTYQLSNFRKGINPWSATNTGGTDPRLAVDVPSDPEVAINNEPETSRWLENGSYVRIRNIELGYNLSPKMFHGFFTNAKLYLSGQNLLTFTKYKGMDPDVTGGGIGARGFDSGNWPSSRILSIGLNCGF